MTKGSFDQPSSWRRPDGEEARIRLKTQHLLQDFQKLVMDTNATEARLEKAKRKKRILKAQVRFLRRKYENFIKNQPAKLYLGSSNSTSKYQSQIANDLFSRRTPNPYSRLKFKLKGNKNCPRKEAVLPSTTASIDMNWTMVPNEREGEAQAVSRVRRIKKALWANPSMKPSVHRDAGTEASEFRKRKISWQDPVALRVES